MRARAGAQRQRSYTIAGRLVADGPTLAGKEEAVARDAKGLSAAPLSCTKPSDGRSE